MQITFSFFNTPIPLSFSMLLYDIHNSSKVSATASYGKWKKRKKQKNVCLCISFIKHSGFELNYSV